MIRHNQFSWLDVEHTQIKGRCSHGRGAVLQHIRPVIEALFNMNVAKPSVVRNNVETANKLLANNAFYFAVRCSFTWVGATVM